MTFLADLMAPLNHVLFTIGNDQVTSAELLGFITGLWCVWLTVKVKIGNFPVGIANSFFFLVLFLAAGLYADAGLQVVYIVLGIVGWWQWLHGGEGHTRLDARWASGREIGILIMAVVLITWALTMLLGYVNDVAPFWDALTTALSLAAQWLLNTKKVQTWWFWIAADVIYIPLYGSKHLWLTSAVYVVFLTLCFRGLAAWRRAAADEVAPVTARTLEAA